MSWKILNPVSKAIKHLLGGDVSHRSGDIEDQLISRKLPGLGLLTCTLSI